MKEYKSNILTVIWDVKSILLLVLLSLIDVAMVYFLDNLSGFPLFFDYFGAMAGACIGGPILGVLIALLSTIIRIIFGINEVNIIFVLEAIALAVFVGVYVRLGFFYKKRGVIIGAVLCALMEAFFITAMHLALYGAQPQNYSLYKSLFFMMRRIGMLTPFASLVGFFVTNVLDKGIILFIIYFLITKMPDSIAKFFEISKDFPQAVVVNNQGEEDFLAESEKLKAKAQEKIDKRREKEES
ncbi:hypothetical protein M2454_002026 [Aequitasia blattaphilus]|uniref:Cytochrome oxidase subunit II transmembrane region profile domain-containing protein n=1 Tax=Aequitasia blattaphilus TaxID=2949332 RepID=A0ABT1EE12_9FIRM|nr:hypothetical protein [Aequitasia blattaphilus]MCP1102712.1 hypothetical protein [Aequitasia blattaphilus]MCR8615352.1 hypothetical protein [Aequitasia blattaphilus]